MLHSGGFGRRSLLIRSCQAAAAALIRALPFPRPANAQPALHLHPRYREQTPLDAAVRKTKTGLDEFFTEKDHDRIAATLAEWSQGLLETPQRLQAIEESLAAGFSGTSPRPIQSHVDRPRVVS